MMNGGDWKRSHHEQHVRHGQRLSSPAPSTRSASQHSTPGILVFSHTGQLLHMNRRALDMAGYLNQAETGPVTMTLSRLVIELRVQIQDTLDSRRGTNVWELFELKRFLSEFGRKIVLRGFGLPNRNSIDHSRVIIILEEVSLEQERAASQARAKVQSPDRQGAV